MSDTDEQPDRLRVSWEPATPGDVSAALTAGEAERPDDWPERLTAALAALRGWSVLRGISVYGGEVWIPARDLHMSGGSKIEHCQVLTEDPMVVQVERPEQFTGNEGNAIQAVRVRP